MQTILVRYKRSIGGRFEEARQPLSISALAGLLFSSAPTPQDIVNLLDLAAEKDWYIGILCQRDPSDSAFILHCLYGRQPGHENETLAPVEPNLSDFQQVKVKLKPTQTVPSDLGVVIFKPPQRLTQEIHLFANRAELLSFYRREPYPENDWTLARGDQTKPAEIIRRSATVQGRPLTLPQVLSAPSKPDGTVQAVTRSASAQLAQPQAAGPPVQPRSVSQPALVKTPGQGLIRSATAQSAQPQAAGPPVQPQSIAQPARVRTPSQTRQTTQPESPSPLVLQAASAVVQLKAAPLTANNARRQEAQAAARLYRIFDSQSPERVIFARPQAVTVRIEMQETSLRVVYEVSGKPLQPIFSNAGNDIRIAIENSSGLDITVQDQTGVSFTVARPTAQSASPPAPGIGVIRVYAKSGKTSGDDGSGVDKDFALDQSNTPVSIHFPESVPVAVRLLNGDLLLRTATEFSEAGDSGKQESITGRAGESGITLVTFAAESGQ